MNAQLKTLLILLSVVLNVAFVSGWSWRTLRASAAPVDGRPPLGSVTGATPLHQQLHLTPQQRQQIEPRLDQFRSETAATFSEVNRRRDELLELLAAPQPDRELIRAKQQEILAGQHQCQESLIAHILAEKQLLSADQQRKYFDLLRQQASTRLPERILGPSRAPRTSGTQPSP
jgi:Spy/CpxP family protein refolding chaperone